MSFKGSTVISLFVDSCTFKSSVSVVLAAKVFIVKLENGTDTQQY